MPEIKLPSGQVVLYDEQDRDIVMSRSWFLTPNGYACTKIKTETGKKRTIGMHRLILGDPDTQAIDHLNHDKLDNRRSNLRACSQSDNQRNRDFSRMGRYGSSRFWGVSKHRNKWAVIVNIEGKAKCFGRYDDEHEAATKAKSIFRMKYGENANY